MNKRGKVFYQDRLAGHIEETDEGYEFAYDNVYIDIANAQPVSLTLPITKETYKSKVLFPFFDGLIPEGWLLDIALDNWKINEKDRMELLLTVCKDCIGAVSIERE